MMVVLRLVILGLLLLLPGTSRAVCSSNACTDLPAIENVRAVVASACDCSGADSHGKYVKCAKEIVKSAIANGQLPRTCKKPVVRCEARSTCGKAKSKICLSSMVQLSLISMSGVGVLSV